jgi:hypothetical protein
MFRLEGLDQAEALLAGAAGAAGDLAEQLECAFGGARIAIGEAEIGIDHADQRHVRKVVPLGDELRADDDIDSPFSIASSSSLSRFTPPSMSDDSTMVRASGNASTTSSAMRSIPGPQATR